VTVAFDVELAPIDMIVDMPDMAACMCAVIAPCWQRMLTRTVERQRPFDRGPPRVDRRTALRACTVLLI